MIRNHSLWNLMGIPCPNFCRNIYHKKYSKYRQIFLMDPTPRSHASPDSSSAERNPPACSAHRRTAYFKSAAGANSTAIDVDGIAPIPPQSPLLSTLSRAAARPVLSISYEPQRPRTRLRLSTVTIPCFVTFFEYKSTKD